MYARALLAMASASAAQMAPSSESPQYVHNWTRSPRSWPRWRSSRSETEPSGLHGCPAARGKNAASTMTAVTIGLKWRRMESVKKLSLGSACPEQLRSGLLPGADDEPHMSPGSFPVKLLVKLVLFTGSIREDRWSCATRTRSGSALDQRHGDLFGQCVRADAVDLRGLKSWRRSPVVCRWSVTGRATNAVWTCRYGLEQPGEWRSPEHGPSDGAGHS